MGLMHKDYDIHGFQFHPESISTKMGMKLIKILSLINMFDAATKLKKGTKPNHLKKVNPYFRI